MSKLTARRLPPFSMRRSSCRWEPSLAKATSPTHVSLLGRAAVADGAVVRTSSRQVTSAAAQRTGADIRAPEEEGAGVTGENTLPRMAADCPGFRGLRQAAGSLPDALRAVAQPHQARYGANSAAATRSSRASVAISAASVASRAAITAREAGFSRALKKTPGHAALSASCARWRRRARGEVACTRHPATATATYNADHTGPNAEAGGAHSGFSRRA